MEEEFAVKHFCAQQTLQLDVEIKQQRNYQNILNV